MVSLAVELPRPAADADEVRRALADVLSRPEYAEAAPSLAAQIRSWVAEQLGRLLEAVVGSGQASLIGSLLIVALVLVAAVLTARFARRLQRDPAAVGVSDDGVGRTPADWEAEAEEHERAGRRRDALRCRYRALVAGLAAAGVVDEAPGRTTGEYLTDVRTRRPAATADVAAVTAAFEAAWYGHDPVDTATLDEARRRAQAALAAATAASATTRDPASAAAGETR